MLFSSLCGVSLCHICAVPSQQGLTQGVEKIGWIRFCEYLHVMALLEV